MKRLATFVLALSILPACDEQGSETVVGPRGGTITSPDGRFVLDIPAGALDEDVEIRVAEVDDAPEGGLGPVYELTPRGTAFARPARITFYLDVDMTALASHGDLALVSEKNGTWYYMADRKLDLDAGTVSASAVYLSSFAPVLVVGDDDDDDRGD